MKTIKKRVAELEGAQLDWAVAVASGFTRARMSEVYAGEWIMPDGKQVFAPWFKPSSDWKQGGPIIERGLIVVYPVVHYSASGESDAFSHWVAVTDGQKHRLCAQGHTPLIAAMRAFVASKLGDEVEVPV